MRPVALLLLLPLLAVSASAPAQRGGEPLNAELDRVRAEQASAEARARQLERAASQARSEAERLHAQQAAAAQGIEAAEARITVVDAELRLITARAALWRQRLAREQQPVASLLAGLAIMGSRPPLLAIADRGSTDEMVEVRLLLNATLPAIRRRTAAISAQLQEGRRLEQAALAARNELVRSRTELAGRRQRFAELESRALASAAGAGGEALGLGDVALAAGEDVERLRSEGESRRVALQVAAQLASEAPSPPRPGGSVGPPAAAPFVYVLPSPAPVTTGLGTVNQSGIRSRGLALATHRGQPLTVPASGTVRFAGPYQRHDGVLIIDHGQGWLSLILNAATPLKRGDRVRVGEPLGRALGPIGVELSHNGRRVSPALIAGSSETLSKRSKGG